MVYTIVVHLYAKDSAECISKLKAKLVEASQVYSQDRETLSWFVMQDTKDERAFTIVERYEKESVCIPPRTQARGGVEERDSKIKRIEEKRGERERKTELPEEPLLTNPPQNRARNTTSRTLTGRPSIPTSSRCSSATWTCAASRKWTRRRPRRLPRTTTRTPSRTLVLLRCTRTLSKEGQREDM
jgi:hypothetical protein